MFTAGGTVPRAAAILGAGQKSFDQLPGLVVLEVFRDPKLGPALGGRQLTGTAEQELVLGNAPDVIIFQQLAKMSDYFPAVGEDVRPGNSCPSCRPSSSRLTPPPARTGDRPDCHVSFPGNLRAG
jgi:hypothetical protein